MNSSIPLLASSFHGGSTSIFQEINWIYIYFLMLYVSFVTVFYSPAILAAS